MGRDIFHCIWMLTAPSNLTLNASSDAASTTLGQPIPVYHHPHYKEYLPYIRSKSVFFWFKSVETSGGLQQALGHSTIVYTTSKLFSF